MRDTNALRAARETESDPYRRRFPFPKWNRTITVTDEPRLFKRLPEFAHYRKIDHERVSREYLEQLQADNRVYTDIQQRYTRQFGTNGSMISGGFYDSWPDYAKEACRFFAHRHTRFADISMAHWRAAGRTHETWVRLRQQQG